MKLSLHPMIWFCISLLSSILMPALAGAQQPSIDKPQDYAVFSTDDEANNIEVFARPALPLFISPIHAWLGVPFFP